MNMNLLMHIQCSNMYKDDAVKRVTVVIPAYNEERFIEKVVTDIKRMYDISVLVSDDGSKDNTYYKATECADIVIKHEHNMGKGRTIIDGVKKAGDNFDYAILMDGDYQHHPADIAKFIKMDFRNYDIIIGRRDMSIYNMPIIRYLTNRMTTLAVSLLAGRMVYDSQSGYRMVRVESFLKIPIKTFRFQMESEMLIRGGRMGMKIGFVDVQTIYGDEKSKINPLFDTMRFIKMVLEALWV